MLLTFRASDLDERCTPQQAAEVRGWFAQQFGGQGHDDYAEIRVLADPSIIVLVGNDGEVTVHTDIADPAPFVEWPADEHGRMADA